MDLTVDDIDLEEYRKDCLVVEGAEESFFVKVSHVFLEDLIAFSHLSTFLYNLVEVLNFMEVNSLNSRRCSREVFINHFGVYPNAFKELRPSVGV